MLNSAGVARAAALVVVLTLGGCAARAPQSPPPSSNNLAADAQAEWTRRIEPRFTPFLEGRQPALREGLRLTIVAGQHAPGPCVSRDGEMRVASALLDELHQVAAAVAFSAARPEQSPRLVAFLRQSRAARGAADSALPASSFAAFAGVAPEEFARVLREPQVATMQRFIERDALSVVLAQRIGRIAARAESPAASAPIGCSRAEQAQADAFAFDIIQATRRSPAQGQFPVFAMFVLLDTDPWADPSESRPPGCRAAYFARRELAVTPPPAGNAEAALLAVLANRPAHDALSC